MRILRHFVSPWIKAGHDSFEIRPPRNREMSLSLRLRYFSAETPAVQSPSNHPRRINNAIPQGPSGINSIVEKRIYVSLSTYSGSNMRNSLPEGMKIGSDAWWRAHLDHFVVSTFADSDANTRANPYWATLESERQIYDTFDRDQFVRSADYHRNPFIEGGQAVGYHAFQLEILKALHIWKGAWRDVFRQIDEGTKSLDKASKDPINVS